MTNKTTQEITDDCVESATNAALDTIGENTYTAKEIKIATTAARAAITAYKKKVFQ